MVVLVVLVVRDVGAGSAVVVGRATPGARCGAGAWGGNRVAEATRAARTAKVSPKATSRSLQGRRRGLARCRGDGVGMCMVPVRLLLPMKAAPGQGAATGHIGRSLAERIEWRVRVRCRPRPSPTHQPIKLNLDEAAAPRAAAHGFSLKPSAGRPPQVLPAVNVAGDQTTSPWSNPAATASNVRGTPLGGTNDGRQHASPHGPWPQHGIRPVRAQRLLGREASSPA